MCNAYNQNSQQSPSLWHLLLWQQWLYVLLTKVVLCFLMCWPPAHSGLTLNDANVPKETRSPHWNGFALGLPFVFPYTVCKFSFTLIF